MSKTVWLITGAGRGMGTDIAKAALAAGHAAVATGAGPERVTAALAPHEDLLAVKLDGTKSRRCQRRPTPIETFHPHSPMATAHPFWVTPWTLVGKNTSRR